MKQVIDSLNKLSKEMFTVTGRGGMLLILTFFYIGTDTYSIQWLYHRNS